MKQPYYYLATFLLIIASVFSQHAANAVVTQASATATLSLELSELRSITVNTPHVTVPIATTAQYQTGNATDVANHLQVTSAGAYKITATSASANFVNGTNTIPVNTVTLTPSPAAVSGGGTMSYMSQQLVAGTPGTLVEGTAGTTNSSFNVRYTASGGSAYLVPAGTYTTVVTYTIAAP